MGNDHPFGYAIIVLLKIKVLIQTLLKARVPVHFTVNAQSHTHM